VHGFPPVSSIADRKPMRPERTSQGTANARIVVYDKHLDRARVSAARLGGMSHNRSTFSAK
jgi:hypothetical protein